MHQKYFATKNLTKFLLPVGIFVLFIVIWQLLDYLFEIKEVILPSPSETYNAMKVNFGMLLRETWVTTIESVSGLILGSILALVMASWFTFSRRSKQALYPYAIALKATPLYALAPLLVLWFGNDMLSKIVMSALVAFFPILVNSVQGLSAITQEEHDFMHSLSASPWQIYFKLRLPRALPFIFPALKISSTLAVVGAVIAEFTGASKGIGHLIVNSSYYLDTSLMFAGIIMISLVGMALFGLVALIERQVVFWKN